MGCLLGLSVSSLIASHRTIRTASVNYYEAEREMRNRIRVELESEMNAKEIVPKALLSNIISDLEEVLQAYKSYAA